MHVGHFLRGLIRVIVDVYLFTRLLLLIGILDVASPISLAGILRLADTGFVRLVLGCPGRIFSGMLSRRVLTRGMFPGLVGGLSPLRLLVGGLLSLHGLFGAFLVLHVTLRLLRLQLFVLLVFHTPIFNR